MKGITLVAPPSPIGQAEMDELERESHKQHLEEENQQKKAQQEELQQKVSVKDGEVKDAEKGKETGKDVLPSKKLELEYKTIKENLDGLKETKKEMVWLLRQVITEEKKRKAAESTIPKKKAAKL